MVNLKILVGMFLFVGILIFLTSNLSAINSNSADSSAIIDFYPKVNLISPSNGMITLIASKTFTADFIDINILANSTFYIWNSTNAIINTTFQERNGTSNSSSILFVLPYEGDFKWNYYVCGVSNICMFNSTNWSLTYSTIPSTGTATKACRYKKFGYYNLRLPWFRQENCI